jgi:prophage regulatory protein
MSSPSIQRVPVVLSRTGDGRSTLYSRIADGLWPKPVKIGPRSVGWPTEEVSALINARIAALSEPEIRDLVRRLELARGAAKPGTAPQCKRRKAFR